MLAILFPGVLIGFPVARIFGIGAGVVACTVSNGVAYGLLLYGWNRLLSAVAEGLPKWLNHLAVRLSRSSSHR